MSVDILGTSWDQCRSMVQYSFTSIETEGSLGRTAQDGHLDSHTAPELFSFLHGLEYNMLCRSMLSCATTHPRTSSPTPTPHPPPSHPSASPIMVFNLPLPLSDPKPLRPVSPALLFSVWRHPNYPETAWWSKWSPRNTCWAHKGVAVVACSGSKDQHRFSLSSAEECLEAL